jgi:4-hydroxythreonine-4-phosphate dehydrogenase
MRFDRALPVLPLAAGVADGRAGVPSVADAPAVIESIERAVGDVGNGHARAVVTAPIQKETLYRSGFGFPGHTEFLGALTQDWPGGGHPPVMMLASDALRVVPVTVHVPLAQVAASLTEDLIVATGTTVATALRAQFGLARPRLAVAGLNPHAGEGGRLGIEDRDIIAPAIARLRAGGIDATGPFPADTMFHTGARSGYDVALMMYHDQALIPIKTISFDTAVNVTLGLPLVRTSPDHGTALQIAGTGKANPASYIAALRLAHTLSQTR